MGLNHAVRERVEAMGITDPLTRRIHIKMSGCPNGCSQHHIGNIGFYGASIKVGEHTIPAYVAHIAGSYEGGEIVYGARLKVRLPAKRVPEAVERWIRGYEADRLDGEEFNAYAERVGMTRFEDQVRDLAMPIEFGLETMEHFIDWQKKIPFQVIRGEGECAI
jgi:sulfite reductase beta subunit-like hemoprotein